MILPIPANGGKAATPKTITIGRDTFTILFPDLLEPMTPEERAGLKAMIREAGEVQVPIFVDENNGVIDGINRLEIAEELGINFVPKSRVTPTGATIEQKREMAIKYNLNRRNLTPQAAKVWREKMRQKFRQEAATTTKSIRQMAEEAGVDKRLVERDIKDTPRPETVTGKDGKNRQSRSTVSHETVEIAGTLAKFDEALSLARKLAGVIDEAARMPGGDLLCRTLQVKSRDGEERLASVDLENVIGLLKTQRPFKPCPYCKHAGGVRAECKACLGGDWVTERIWNSSPEEYREGVAT